MGTPGLEVNPESSLHEGAHMYVKVCECKKVESRNRGKLTGGLGRPSTGDTEGEVLWAQTTVPGG